MQIQSNYNLPFCNCCIFMNLLKWIGKQFYGDYFYILMIVHNHVWYLFISPTPPKKNVSLCLNIFIFNTSIYNYFLFIWSNYQKMYVSCGKKMERQKYKRTLKGNSAFTVNQISLCRVNLKIKFCRWYPYTLKYKYSINSRMFFSFLDET